MLNYEKERSTDIDYVYYQRDTNLNFGMHLHTSYEFIYVYDGLLQIIIEDKSYDIPAGHATLILPNQIHAYRTPEYSQSFLCVFSVSFAYSFYMKTKDKESVPPPVFHFDEPRVIEEVLVPHKDEYLLKSVFYKIISCFNKNAVYRDSGNKVDAIVRKILLYAENNFDKDVTLHDLASEFAYSYNYLSNILNDSLHMNFSTLINTQRINRAIYLIKNTKQNFTEIAINCGYSSIRSFNRNFKQLTGKSPSDFRKEI